MIPFMTGVITVMVIIIPTVIVISVIIMTRIPDIITAMGITITGAAIIMEDIPAHKQYLRAGSRKKLTDNQKSNPHPVISLAASRMI